MSGMLATEDRVFEATPTRRRLAVEQGQGPRMPWLASAAGGLLAVVLLSAAAGPLAGGAREWLRSSLAEVSSAEAGSVADVLRPAIACTLAVCLATLGASILVHGPWIRLAVRRRGGRRPWASRVASDASGWMLGGVAIAAGVLASLPWLPAVSRLANRGFEDGALAVIGFVAAVGVAALLAVAVMGLLQWWMAVRRFDRMLRMTRAEAREEAKEDRAPATARRPRWRTA